MRGSRIGMVMLMGPTRAATLAMLMVGVCAVARRLRWWMAHGTAFQFA
ncbi:hypothetical protein X566_13945 [Afipia sp. P52-10]|nr:hypothetical protein X566_13945 [Afipia sp. P52-10]